MKRLSTTGGRRRRWIALGLSVALCIGWFFSPQSERMRVGFALRKAHRIRSTPQPEAATDSKEAVRAALGEALAELGPRGLRALEYELAYHDPNWAAKRDRLHRVPLVGSALANRVEDPAAVRRRAARWLGFMGSAAEDSVDDLLQAAGDTHASVQRNVAFALGAIGVDRSDVVDVLERLAGSPDPSVRAFAVVSLWRLSAGESGASRRLWELLEGDAAGEVAIALIDIGPAADPLLPSIKERAPHWSWGLARIQAIDMVWTRDQDLDFVRRELATAATFLDEGLSSLAAAEVESLVEGFGAFAFGRSKMVGIPELNGTLQSIFQALLSHDSLRGEPPSQGTRFLAERALQRLRESGGERSSEGGQ